MFFQSLRETAEFFELTRIERLLQSLFSDIDIQELVIELNTDEQLYQGIDSEGVDLSSIGGNYSPVTVLIKRFKGQPVDRITLKDAGDFYRSFAINAGRKEFVISANTIKEGIDLQGRWGKDLLGLTEESKRELIFNLIPLLISEIRKKL